MLQIMNCVHYDMFFKVFITNQMSHLLDMTIVKKFNIHICLQ